MSATRDRDTRSPEFAASDPTLHVRVEMLEALKRQGLPAGHFLRLLVHLKHLCPICAGEIDRFSRQEPKEGGWLPTPKSIWPAPSSAATEKLKREGQEEASRLAKLAATDRTAALAAGVFQATPALFHAWMRRLESVFAEATDESRGYARFALEIAQRLDAEKIPTLLLIDHQVEAWLALAQEALRLGHTGQATLALRTAYLLNDGGTGDPQQFAWLQTLHGLLLSQKGDLEAGSKLLAEGGEVARLLDDAHLLGGIQLLHGLILIELSQHQTAASTLRDGIDNVDHSRAPGLVESAREALALMGESAELVSAGEEPANC